MAMLRASSRLLGRRPCQVAAPLARHIETRSKITFAQHPGIRLSGEMTNRLTRDMLENIDLMVCDMAGTTVNEGGLVYKILEQSIKDGGLIVPDGAMHAWHGAKKEAVIEHFAKENKIPDNQIEDLVLQVADKFTTAIDDAYFDEASTISHIEVSLFSYFSQLRQAGVKIALDTGYPPNIQLGLVKRLGFDKAVDSWISSYEVAEGRPYPYMIHRLMERLHIENVKRVCKVGDSARDMEEGRNAGCGLVVGVLSGADSAEELMAAGADVVAQCVTSLPIPRRPVREMRLRLPDLS